MTVKLLNEHHLKLQSLKEVAQTRLSLHLPKYHIDENHISRLICFFLRLSRINMAKYPCYKCALVTYNRYRSLAKYRSTSDYTFDYAIGYLSNDYFRQSLTDL